MSLTDLVPAAIFETILTRIAALFLIGANNDLTAARQAATHMLSAYRPETEDELRLAANIIGFSFQALEALAQAAAPDMPITRILRLRGNAVSLSRESTTAQRHLDQLQKLRRQQDTPVQPPEQPAPDPTEDAAYLMAALKTHHQPRPQTEEDRLTDLRIAASLKRAELKFGLPPDPAVAAAVNRHHNPTNPQTARA